MRMIIDCYCCCSVAKSCLTLRPPGMQHARLLCPPLSPRVCSNACPSSRWYKWSHPLPPLSPFAFNSQVLSSEGLSRAKKVTHFCSDGWVSWKPPPPSLRAAEGQPGLAGVVLLGVPASCSGWGDGDWQHCLWAHQLFPLSPQAGRFYMSGVGVAGSWECWGGELLTGQSRASSGGEASASLGWCLLTALPPKTEAFILSEQKQQLAKFNCGYGCGDFWDGREANWTHILSTFDLITFVPGTGVCWHVWGCFHQGSRDLELITGLRTVRPTWSLHFCYFLISWFCERNVSARYKRQLLKTMGATPANLVFGGRKKWKEDGERG